MKSPLTSASRVVVLLGDPVSHSLSPTFQNAAFAAAGVDAVYVALRADADDVRGLLLGVARAGGAGNVTLPHKEIAAACVEVPTEAVIRTGACNTFWLEDDRVHGDNTDVAGFLSAIEVPLRGQAVAGARVLLLGAGGAARGAVYALMQAGAGEIIVANRSAARAKELIERFSPIRNGDRLKVRDLDSLPGEHFDLVVNSTSLGLKAEDPLPLPLDGGPTFAAAIDMVYSPARTPWVRALQEQGIPAEDGLEMLVRQGAAAFERWWGFAPSLDAMRKALPPR